MLKGAGWNASIRSTLERWISEGRDQAKIAVFDLDNTLLCRDIGEATLVELLRSGVLKPDGIPEAISPPLAGPGGARIAPSDAASAVKYYEELVALTEHDSRDPAPYSNGYAWAVQAMAGLTADQVVRATRDAYAGGAARSDLGKPGVVSRLELAPGKLSYPRPFFYPEMVELVGRLLEHGFAVWVVSATNVWSARTMAVEALGVELERAGFAKRIAPERVVASTLLLEVPGGKHGGRLGKDALLVRDDPAYAALDPAALARYRLTAQIDYPLPTYSGKVACILQWIRARPYLVAGDGHSDHAMLTHAEHRLWIARLERSGPQRETAELIRKHEPERWAVQPTLHLEAPGFVASRDALARRVGAGGAIPRPWIESLEAFSQ